LATASWSVRLRHLKHRKIIALGIVVAINRDLGIVDLQDSIGRSIVLKPDDRTAAIGIASCGESIWKFIKNSEIGSSCERTGAHAAFQPAARAFGEGLAVVCWRRNTCKLGRVETRSRIYCELVIAMPAKLLIVDDEPLIVELLKRWVSSCGDFDVRIAYDGIEAISIARSFRPDGVLTGIMMPKMNGVEETRRILSFLPDCKVIVVSSNAHVQEYRDAFTALGIDPKFLLQKPFELHELVSALKLAGFSSVAHSPASMPKDSSNDKTVD